MIVNQRSNLKKQMKNHLPINEKYIELGILYLTRKANRVIALNLGIF